MKVQTKLLLLLLLIGGLFLGGLSALTLREEGKFRAIAERRAAERDRFFDQFLEERGDQLKVFVEDFSLWDDLVRALAGADRAWAEENVNFQTLAIYQANAAWICRPDGEVFHSVNNRYAEALLELPLSPAQLAKAFDGKNECHFFIPVPQGWMEVRGATVHQSVDRFRETTPQGYFFAGHIWIDENIRRMSRFTGYSVRIEPAGEALPPRRGGEELGLIHFDRTVPGWDGEPIARIMVENDSPLIRELNRASRSLFLYLHLCAAAVFLVLAVSLIRWVRRPLRIISQNLRAETPENLEPLRRRRDEFGELAQLILHSRETEQALERVEENLRHSQKLEAVGRLAGGVAHDFNNLLTAIIGYSEMLVARLAGQPEERRQAELVAQAGHQAAGLTRQLLAFSRKQLLQPRVIDLNQLVADGRSLLQRVIGEHIEIEVRAGADDARVLADPGQLEQVILNLGVNARDAMPGGGSLTISTENLALAAREAAERDVELPPGDYVVLSVADSGSGMDAGTRSRIFEPFFTTKGPGRGTGLGLATVYGIVKQSHGDIAVHSAPGEGTRFCVYLPRADAPIAPEETAPVPAPSARRAETILVCEDEEVVRELICTVLGEAGYTVLCAELPATALRMSAAHEGHIDLLLSDVVMPGMHGPELARELTERRPGLRVLYVSGYSENDISEQGVVHADLELMQKPFTQDALLRRVRSVIDAGAVPSGA